MNDYYGDGNLTKDPELKYLPSGMATVDINIAHNEKFKKKDGKEIEYTSYFKIVAFGKLAENCAEFLEKGSKIIVKGRLRQDRWTKDEKPQSMIKICAEYITFCSVKKEKSNKTNLEKQQEPEVDQQPIISDEDLPF